MVITITYIENLQRKYEQLLTFCIVKQTFHHTNSEKPAAKIVHNTKFEAMVTPSGERVRNYKHVSLDKIPDVPSISTLPNHFAFYAPELVIFIFGAENNFLNFCLIA